MFNVIRLRFFNLSQVNMFIRGSLRLSYTIQVQDQLADKRGLSRIPGLKSLFVLQKYCSLYS